MNFKKGKLVSQGLRVAAVIFTACGDPSWADLMQAYMGRVPAPVVCFVAALT